MAEAIAMPPVAYHPWGSEGEDSDSEEDGDEKEVEVIVLQDPLSRRVCIMEHLYDVSEHRHMSERDVRDLATFLQTIEEISAEEAESACSLCPTCRAKAGLLGRQRLASRAAPLLLHALHRLLAPLLTSSG